MFQASCIVFGFCHAYCDCRAPRLNKPCLVLLAIDLSRVKTCMLIYKYIGYALAFTHFDHRVVQH